MGHTKLYIIAGEPSGDNLGAKLIHSLRALDPDMIFKGVGGDKIAEQGVESLFPIKDISLMGFIEVLPHLRTVFKRIDQTVDDIIRFQPDVVITIDSPGFCKR
ncbi:MAG: lipid-A-disaccharide synthase, partial [Rickettsiales bacterium]|nr:lipid-A-disaccharide synthase [Rickettsiales bacterium]